MLYLPMIDHIKRKLNTSIIDIEGNGNTNRDCEFMKESIKLDDLRDSRR